MISVRSYGVRIGVKNRVNTFLKFMGNVPGERSRVKMSYARPAGQPGRRAIICRQSDRRRDRHRWTPVLTQLGNWKLCTEPTPAGEVVEIHSEAYMVTF